MKKFKSLIAMLLAFSIMLTACATTTEETQEAQETQETTTETQAEETSFVPVTITDQAGNEVTIETEPKSVAIAGLPPFSSFFIQFTGKTDIIVAMPGGSLTMPIWIERVFPGYADIPTVGMGPNYEVEAILATNPDLIICTTGMPENYEAFRATGIPTIGLSSTADGTNTIKTANSWIEILGQVFNMTDKADAIIAHNNETLEMVTSKVNADEMKTGLMLPDYSETIIEVSNNDYYGGFWLETAGVSNVAAEVVGWESSMEEVLTFNPDVIYLSAFSAYTPSQMLSDSAVAGHTWSATTAGETNAIYKFPVGLFNWYALSPDAAASALWISYNAYPERYEDINLNEEIKNHYAVYGIELTDEEVSDLLNQG